MKKTYITPCTHVFAPLSTGMLALSGDTPDIGDIEGGGDWNSVEKEEPQWDTPFSSSPWEE